MGALGSSEDSEDEGVARRPIKDVGEGADAEPAWGRENDTFVADSGGLNGLSLGGSGAGGSLVVFWREAAPKVNCAAIFPVSSALSPKLNAGLEEVSLASP